MSDLINGKINADLMSMVALKKSLILDAEHQEHLKSIWLWGCGLGSAGLIFSIIYNFPFSDKIGTMFFILLFVSFGFRSEAKAKIRRIYRDMDKLDRDLLRHGFKTGRSHIECIDRGDKINF